MTLLKEMQTIASAGLPEKLWPTFDGGFMKRGTYLSSSETGTCLRKAFYDRKYGVRFEPNGFAERGHVIEDWFVSTLMPLKAAGYGIEYTGKDQRTFYITDLGMSGTPDGLITLPNTGEKIIIEIKSIDPRTNKGNLPKRAHVLQAQQNMLLVSRCLGIEIKRAALIYIDASNLFDQQEFEIPWDTDMQEELLQRADDLDDAVDAAELDAEGMMNDGCQYCQHGAPCSAVVAIQMAAAKKAGSSFFANGDSSELTKPFDPTPEQTITLQRFISAKEQSKQAEEGVDAYNEEVRKMVADNGGSIAWQGAVLTLTVQAGQVTFDKDKVSAFAKQHDVKVSDLQKQGNPFTKLGVKL